MLPVRFQGLRYCPGQPDGILVPFVLSGSSCSGATSIAGPGRQRAGNVSSDALSSLRVHVSKITWRGNCVKSALNIWHEAPRLPRRA